MKAKEFLKEVIREDWMSESDVNELVEGLLSIPGAKNLKTIQKEIEIGVENGHSIEEQISICRIGYKKLVGSV